MSHLSLVPDAEPPITNRELDRQIYNPQTFERVIDGIQTLLKSHIKVIPHMKLLHPKSNLAFGTVMHPIDQEPALLAVSAGFPNALRDNAGLSTEEAIQFSVDYIHAYQIITRAVRSGRSGRPLVTHNHNFNGSLEPGLWAPEYYYESGAARALPYRAAATVAFETQGVSVLKIDGAEPPYPGHIASLQNPLDLVQFRTLSSAIKG